MTGMNEFIPIFIGIVFVASLVAVGWAHWYSRDARRLERELEELEQRRHPAE